jgi:hypothetical protein
LLPQSISIFRAEISAFVSHLSCKLPFLVTQTPNRTYAILAPSNLQDLYNIPLQRKMAKNDLARARKIRYSKAAGFIPAGIFQIRGIHCRGCQAPPVAQPLYRKRLRRSAGMVIHERLRCGKTHLE